MIGADRGDLWRWEGFDPARLIRLMRDFDARWWIAGGRALDLWLGRETREHRDVDLAIFRSDQQLLAEALPDLDLYYASPDHRLHPLEANRWLEPPIHGIWARQDSESPWVCEFLLNEHDERDWTYRRDTRVRKPLSEVGTVVDYGNWRLPVLVPEVVLLYKAHDLTVGKASTRAQADFESTAPHLDARATSWLRKSIATTSYDHPWLNTLSR